MRNHVISYWPLIVVFAAVFALKLYLALIDPVLHAADPWLWALVVERLAQGSLIEQLSMIRSAPSFFSIAVYPKAYPLLAALIAVATGTSGYEVVRFYPVVSAFNLIPMYFLSLFVSKSRRVAAVSIVLVSISRWYAIRTSIGNPECFTHFWLIFSLLFLLRLRYTPTWRNMAASIFFMTMSAMFWYLPVAIYAVFLPLLCIVNLRNTPYFTKLILVVILSGFFAGVLWYFYTPNPFGAIVFIYTVVDKGLRSSFFTSQNILSSFMPLLVKHWGYILPILGVSGFVYTLAHRQLRRNPSSIFLTVYSASIIILIFMSLIIEEGKYDTGVTYLFSSATFPLSIFAAIALMKSVDKIETVTRSHNFKSVISSGSHNWIRRRSTQILSISILILVVVGNLNVLNYGGNHYFALTLNDLTFQGSETVSGNVVSPWIVTFQYDKWPDSPSKEVYDALRWIRDNTGKQACVIAFLTPPPPVPPLPPFLTPSPDVSGGVLRKAFSVISERSFLEGIGFNSTLMNSPTAFREAALNASNGTDVYIVIGVRSWQGEDRAYPHLESQFLYYADQTPDLFPQVYSAKGVHVFCITGNPRCVNISIQN